MSESARHAAVARNLDALLAARALGLNELSDRLGFVKALHRTRAGPLLRAGNSPVPLM